MATFVVILFSLGEYALKGAVYQTNVWLLGNNLHDLLGFNKNIENNVNYARNGLYTWRMLDTRAEYETGFWVCSSMSSEQVLEEEKSEAF